jgi:hypothetical protein
MCKSINKILLVSIFIGIMMPAFSAEEAKKDEAKATEKVTEKKPEKAKEKSDKKADKKADKKSNAKAPAAEESIENAADKASGKGNAKAATSAVTTGVPATNSDLLAEDTAFRKKLNEYLLRLEKSIDLIKGQILENQSAPFLADLNLQYAELLAQRANALYYIEMEKGVDIKKGEKAFIPVVNAQKESVVVLRNLLRDFPNFDKRKKTLLQLAVALQSIDEEAEFVQIAQQIMKSYPNSEEDVKARLYLSKMYADKGQYAQTKSVLQPVFSSKYVYEKNLGRYRLAQVLIREDKLKEALEYLILVVTDKELTQEDKPQEVSLELKGVKQDLKREALVETIVPYTTINQGKNDNPVEFYSKIVPTEGLFQEVIEKLSFRYVFLKEYQKAIRLLRTLVERLADTAKVLNIYREVLKAIPSEKRLEIDVAEIDYVMEFFHRWRIVMDTDQASRQEALLFFEEQVRELATQSQTLAQKAESKVEPKIEKKPNPKKLKKGEIAKKDEPKTEEKLEPKVDKKKYYLQRAQAFYELYLNHFEGAPAAPVMAINLASVYFNLGDFTKSGETYLRIMRSEFGKPPANGAALLRNAILSLHKEKDTSFYQQIRVKGLLISSIQTLFKFKPQERKNAELVFLLNRARYEQGFFDLAIAGFYSIITKAPTHARAIDSANIILDHYNLRSDYKGLEAAAKKIAKAGIKDSRYIASLQTIEKQAQTKQLDRIMNEQTNFDGFAQAKGYYETALSLGNGELKNVALSKALAKSRSDKDQDTFFKALSAMKKSEKDPAKQLEIAKLERTERLGMGQFYSVLNQNPPLNDAIDIALILKDWNLLAKLSQGGAVPPATRATIQEQAMAALEGPVSDRDVSSLSYLIRNSPLNDRAVMVLFKNQARLDSSTRSAAVSEARKRCPAGANSALCKWVGFQNLESERLRLVRSMRSSNGALAELESLGKGFESFVGSYKGLENSGDAHLEVALNVMRHDLFLSFGEFLQKASSSNPAMKDLLGTKANETKQLANTFLETCRSIVNQNFIWTPANGECFQAKTDVTYMDVMTGLQTKYSAPGRDPASESGIGDAQRLLFADPKNPGSIDTLASKYADEGYYAHAAATSALGLISSSHNPILEGRLGCSLMNMGLFANAAPLLKNASAGDGPAEQCRATFLERIKH